MNDEPIKPLKAILPYYPLKKAAEVINIEQGELIELISQGFIPAFANINAFGNFKITLNKNVYEEILNTNAGFEIDLEGDNATKLYVYDVLGVTERLSDYSLLVSGCAYGMWQIGSGVQFIPHKGDEPSWPVSLLPKPYPEDLGLSLEFNGGQLDDIEKEFCGNEVIKLETLHMEQVLISAHSLRHIHEKLHRGEYFGENNINANRQEVIDDRKTRSPRTERSQSDMIKALLCLLPDLNKELKNSPSNAPNIIDSYLIKHNLPPLNLGDKNYQNWMKKAKYSPSVENK